MSSFQCEHCQAMIHDSPTGYTSGCEHYPKPDTPAVAPQGVSGHITAKLSNMKRKQPSIQGTDEALDSRQLGNDERYVGTAYYCKKCGYVASCNHPPPTPNPACMMPDGGEGACAAYLKLERELAEEREARKELDISINNALTVNKKLRKELDEAKEQLAVLRGMK